MTTITVGIDTSRSYNRKVPPGGKCSDLFSSDGRKTEQDSKPRKIDRQRSSIDFAPDLSEVTKGLDRQISEPTGGKQQIEQVKSRAETETKGATKPTEIDGKIKSNGAEPGPIQAKPTNIQVKNCSAEDKSSPSEVKPVLTESAVKTTEGRGTPAKANPGTVRNSTSEVENQSCEDKQELTQCEPTKKESAVRVEPSKKESAVSAEPSKKDSAIRVEPTKIESNIRVEPTKIESSQSSAKSGDSCGAPVVVSSQPARTRRIPPGGHCSQLW